MAISARILSFASLLLLWSFASASANEGGAAESPSSAVLTLDASNFTDIVAKHPFIVVEFYAPWCGHCKKLEPEYEKAATILSNYDPSIVLAKIDANDASNKDLASKFEVRGFPTLKILRNEGKNIHDFKGPRDADGIVEYLKKQAGPASSEFQSSDYAANFINEKKILIVGVFPEYSGEEFDNFIILAEKLRSDYDFGHTSDAKILPLGDATNKGPFVRLFKPFDELFVDFQDFHVDALESFIYTASVPVVTIFDKDPINHPFVMKFFSNPYAKAMLFFNFGEHYFKSFKSRYYEAAKNYKGKQISFLMGDLDASQGAFKYFGVREDQAPLIILQESGGLKFLKANLEPDQIETWFKDYMDGRLPPFRKSEPIPEVNNESVKVVVADSLDDMVFKSGKNVLLEFYAPWCGHCKKLAPILDEVASSLQDDASVVVAKMDATANDLPSQFEVQGYPTLYFSSASGKLMQYEGGRTLEDITDFIKKHKDAVSESPESHSVMDEL